MATGGLTEDYRCGYCLQDFRSMTDPRELACHHVFCLSCLQGDFRNGGGVDCQICGSRYVTLNLEALTKVTINRDADKKYVCDNTNCEEAAIIYCVKCEDKICTTHQQAHNEYFNDRHKVLPIRNYVESGRNIERPKCQKHKEVLGQACTVCDKLFCIACNLYEGCTEVSLHDFHRFDELEAEINLHYIKLQDSLRTRLTETCKLQKQAWSSLEREENACSTMKSTIDRVRDEQIKRIAEESEELKDGVDEYLLDITEQVEMYGTELVVKKESLEEQQKQLHTLARSEHMAVKIQQKKILSEELKNSLTENLKKQLRLRTLIRKATSRGMCLELIKLPSTLTYLAEQDVGSSCYSSCFNKTGDSILIGTQDGVKVFDMRTFELSIVRAIQTNVTSGVIHDKKLYTINRSRFGQDKDIVSVHLLEDMTKWATLFEFPRSKRAAALLAVSDQYVIANNPDTAELVIYNTQSKQTKYAKLSVTPIGIAFSPDNGLLVTGNSKLIKYAVDNGDMSEVWHCKDVNGAKRIDCDLDGLIYVFKTLKSGGGCVHIFSPDGKRLIDLTNDKLGDVRGTISVRGDVIAGAGWGDNKLHLFTINR